jgi:hypothetical protein
MQITNKLPGELLMADNLIWFGPVLLVPRMAVV